jgi:TRAP-type C4-dicarboxylate transport system permease small subunit
MERLGNLLVRVVTLLAGVGLVLMMLQVNADVLGRYLFTMPVPLTMELVTYYYMTLVGFLPLMALERRPGGMIHVELFYGAMPAGLRRWVFVFAMAAGAVYCGYAAYAAWEPAMKAFSAGSYVGSIYTIASWPTRFAPVVGLALLAVAYAAKCLAGIRDGGSADTPAALDGLAQDDE